MLNCTRGVQADFETMVSLTTSRQHDCDLSLCDKQPETVFPGLLAVYARGSLATLANRLQLNASPATITV